MKLASGRLVARGGFGEKIRQSLGAPAPACLSPPQARALGPVGVGLSAAGDPPRWEDAPIAHPGHAPAGRPWPSRMQAWLFVLRCKYALKLAHAPGVPLCRRLSLERQ